LPDSNSCLEWRRLLEFENTDLMRLLKDRVMKLFIGITGYVYYIPSYTDETMVQFSKGNFLEAK